MTKKTEEKKIIPTQEEMDMIEHKRELAERMFVKDSEAYKIAVMCDADYKRFNTMLKHAEGWLFKIAINKKMLNDNKVDLEKGETTQKFKDGREKNLVDLKIENIQLENGLQDGVEAVREVLLDIHRHIDDIRIDRKVYFKQEDWDKYIADFISRLMEVGVDLFKERV